MKAGMRTLILAVILVKLVVMSPDALRASELTVVLPPVVEARDGWFYLGEYALLEGGRDITSTASMAVIKHSGSFSTKDVVDALGASGLSGRTVTIRMPEMVRVISEPEIAAELREMTAWKWRIEVGDGKLSWADIMEGYETYSLPPRVLPGSRSLAVKLVDSDGRGFNKQVKLRWYQPVVFSLKPLVKGSPLDLSVLRERIDTVTMNVTNLWAVDQLRNAEVRKPVNAGTPITASDVLRANFVRAGSSVTVVARVNGLGVEVNGIAMQQGDVGDIIKVKNLSSKKIVMGRVIDVGRVEID
ncbi:MAG: flagellar basal body P-ring formation chaperone FlgA [Synergistaceae bacterium]|jgi:flagella basal body P-ring formation protein FlgA|nr:flagellar basal body P-ring formation chaperone FlgA [Synergistaceae bacterium]